MRNLVIAAAIPAVLLWAWEMARRAWHYRDLAAMQAHPEAAHGDEKRRWLARVADGYPGMDGLRRAERVVVVM